MILEKYPALRLEYNENGTKKDTKEILAIAAEGIFDLDLIRNIIRTGNVISNAPTSSTLCDIVEFFSRCNNEEKIEFIGNIISDNIGEFAQKYLEKNLKQKSNSQEDIKEIITMYRMISLIENTNFKQNSVGKKIYETGFYKISEYGKSTDKPPIEWLKVIKTRILELYPNIEQVIATICQRQQEAIEKNKTQSVNSTTKSHKIKSQDGNLIKKFMGLFGRKKSLAYYELKEVEADIEGKKQVQYYENQLQMQENGIEL